MKKSQNDGFILFEVLISVTILSIACLFLSSALSTAICSSRAAQDYYSAYLALETILWDVDHGNPISLPITSEELDRFAWTVERKSVRNRGISESLVVVSWEAPSGRKESLALSGYALGQ